MSFVFAGPRPALVLPPEVRAHPGAQTNLNAGQLDLPFLGEIVVCNLRSGGCFPKWSHLSSLYFKIFFSSSQEFPLDSATAF